jgi:uncharacterized membrane protein YeaQ/YmgE (transglycosylase-associated protein family)
MLNVLWWIITGFVVGLLARALLPGVQQMGFIATTLLGVVGSLVGGVIGRLASKQPVGTHFHRAGFFLSLIGAILALFLWQKLG